MRRSKRRTRTTRRIKPESTPRIPFINRPKRPRKIRESTPITQIRADSRKISLKKQRLRKLPARRSRDPGFSMSTLSPWYHGQVMRQRIVRKLTPKIICQMNRRYRSSMMAKIAAQKARIGPGALVSWRKQRKYQEKC